MRGELGASTAEAVLIRLRPAGEVGRIRLQLAYDHLAGIKAPGAKMKAAGAQIAAAVAATGTTLTTLFGIGPVIAGRLVAETGGVARFPTTGHFASCNGTAPTGASSGEQARHRLSRAGNRRTSPRAAHDGRHPDPLPRHARPAVLRAQAHRGQDPQPSPALPHAAALRPGLPPARRRRARQNRGVRITDDPAADAACIHLTGGPLTPGRTTIQASTPPGAGAFVALGWKGDRLVGPEIPGASSRRPHDFPGEAEIIS